jgi:hypothetical protein
MQLFQYVGLKLFFLMLQEHAQLKNCGLDLYEGVVRDNKKAGVFEPAISKVGGDHKLLTAFPFNK